MAQLAEWPAVVTCGRTVEEARTMLLDAAREMIASYRDEGREPPIGGGQCRAAHDRRRRGLKRRELERHLAAHGCEVLREGANHTTWHNPPSDLHTPVPRHRENPTGTARAICRQLSIPLPAGGR